MWIVVWKSIPCLPCTIGPTDIIRLINQIFPNSYGGINSNLKALEDCRWNPPNSKLLEHKDHIVNSRAPKMENSLTMATSNKSAQSITLNIQQRMVVTVLGGMLAEHAGSSHEKQMMRGKRKGELIMQNLKLTHKLRSGVMASNGILSLHDPRSSQAYNEKRRETSEKLAKNPTARKVSVMKKM